MNNVTHPLSSADISNLSPEISKFCYINKYMFRLHFDTKFLSILTFFESSMMSAKMATSGLLKIKVIKGIKFMTSWFLPMTSPNKIYHVIQIILKMRSCDQGLVTLAFLWEKLSKSRFYKDLTRKPALFEKWSWLKFNDLGLALVWAYNFTTVWQKG